MRSNFFLPALVALSLAIASTVSTYAQKPTSRALKVHGPSGSMTIMAPEGANIVMDLGMLPTLIDQNTDGVPGSELVVFRADRGAGGVISVRPVPAPVTVIPLMGSDTPAPGTTASADDREDHVDGATIAASPVAATPSGIVMNVQTIDLPVFKEYESHIVRLRVPGAVQGAVVMTSPQGHLPSGFVIAYSTCPADNVVEVRVVNLTVDCIDPQPLPFSIAVVNATAARR